MLTYKFNLQKTLQAASVLLQEHHGRMEYIRLLKLLYITDRELLAETGRTLTGDRAVAMKNGPVLSGVYDMIKGKGLLAELVEWNSTICRDGYEVTLDKPASPTRLTKAETKKLREVCVRYRETDSYELSELTHRFDEWVKSFDITNPTSCFPIDWESVLVAQNKADLIQEALFVKSERDMADAAFQE
jgi:uncharacterized phage-associated protein